MHSITIVLLFSFTFACVSTQQSRNKDFDIGNQYAKDGLYKEAVFAYQKAITDPLVKPHVIRNLGMVLVKMKDISKAQTYLEESYNLNPNNFETNFYLAEVYRAQNKLAKAIYHYQFANRLRPDDIRNLRALSWAFYKSRFYSEAYQTAKHLYSLDKKDFESNIILARILIKIQKYKTATNIVKSAIKYSNSATKPHLYSVLGDIYFKTGSYEDALRAYSISLRDNPLLASALFGYGSCLSVKGDKQNAIQYWERAIRVKPNYVDPYFSLAKAYETIDSRKSTYFYKKFRSIAALDIEYLERYNESKDRISFLNTNNKHNKNHASNQNN